MSVTTNFTLNYPTPVNKCLQPSYNSIYSDENEYMKYVKKDETFNWGYGEKNETHISREGTLIDDSFPPKKWDFMMQLYFGSITVVGLYILFKLLQKSN
jgi:hypothetical protein